MEIVFEIFDKIGRKIYLSKERYKHLLNHPSMHNQISTFVIPFSFLHLMIFSTKDSIFCS